MRKAAKFLAFGVALMFGGLTAHADMVITADKLAGTGYLAGWDVYHVFVTNNGVNGTSDNVVGWDIQVDNPVGVPVGTPALSPQPFWFYRTGAGGANVDPKGQAMAIGGVDFDNTGNSSGVITTSNRGIGSFITLQGQDTSGTGTFYDQNQNPLYPSGTGNQPSPTTNANYSTTKFFRVTGSYTMSAANGNANDRLKGTVRLGNVIVPQGAGFIISGKILPVEGDGGQPAKFGVNASFGNTEVPEPASLGLVGLGMLALGRRRRQA